MNLLQLEYFLTAARTGSLSAASRELHVTQPSVSEQVRRLERELGASLFVRTNRDLLLTAAGRRLVPEAENTLNAVRSARAAVEDLAQLRGGTVSLGLFGSAHRYLLKELATELLARFPGIDLRLVGSNSGQVADAIRSGEYDAGLVMTPVDHRDLDLSEPLLSVPLFYWTAVPERRADIVDVPRLAEAPLVLSEARWSLVDPLRLQLSDVAQRTGIEIRPKLEVEFQDAAIEVAATGLVDVIASAVIVEQLGLLDTLHPVPIEPPLHETITVATRKGVRHTGAVAALEQIARTHFERLLSAVTDKGDTYGRSR